MKESIETIGTIIGIGVLVLAFTLAPLLALNEGWPATTVICVLGLTVWAYGRKKLYGVVAITGILLYAVSWPALSWWGKWPSLILACAGYLLWANAILLPGSASTGISLGQKIAR